MLRLSHRLLAIVGLNSRNSAKCITTYNFREHEVNNEGSKLNEDVVDEVAKEEILDEFTKEFFSNQIKVSGFQKILLSAGSSIAALLDPRRHDMIACLGETTGENALEKVLEQMKQSEEGRSILKLKPRINTSTVNLAELKQLPEQTFGYHYYKFLEDNKVTPDSRLEVRFMENPELAYVMTRYRETHDLVHTILGMPTNMLGEVAVKWVEAINTGLPMCYGGAVFGAIRLKTKNRLMYKKYYLPWAIKTGKELKPLLPVYWENRWSENIDDLRKELNISTLELPVDN